MNIKLFAKTQLIKLRCQKYTASVCGHLTRRKGLIRDGDGFSTMTMALGKDGRSEYCIQCIDGMSIRCGWCGGPITIGDPITLALPGEGYNVVGVRHVEEGREAIVGCLAWGCGPGMAMSGHWYPPGQVRRMASPLEMCVSTGKSVFMNDIRSGEVHVIED